MRKKIDLSVVYDSVSQPQGLGDLGSISPIYFCAAFTCQDPRRKKRYWQFGWIFADKHVGEIEPLIPGLELILKFSNFLLNKFSIDDI